MPLFLTLRDREGNALTTAMLPPGGKDRGGFRIIIVAASNADPYPQQDAAIAALGAHFGLTLDRDRCFPTAANDVGSWTLSRRSTASAVMSDLGRTADCSCSGRAFRLMTPEAVIRSQDHAVAEDAISG